MDSRYRSLLAVGGAIITVSATVQRMYESSNEMYFTSLSIGIILVLGGLGDFLIVKFNSHILKFFKNFLRQDKEKVEYKLDYATKKELPDLRDFYSKFFGNDVPSKKLMEHYLNKNPKAFSMLYLVTTKNIKKVTYKLVGSFKLLWLSKRAIHLLELGKVTGSTLKPEHIVQENEAQGLYIGDVAATTRISKGVLQQYLNIAAEQALKKGLTIYARPLTKAGLRVMTEYGFVKTEDNTSPEIGKICRLVFSNYKSPIERKCSRKEKRKGTDDNGQLNFEILPKCSFN